MKKPIRILWLLGLVCVVLQARAQTDQLYFLGSIAPVASMSEVGPKAAYLRWDVLETPLPAQVQTLVLKRNDQVIAQMPAQGFMSAAEIQALYQESGQERRLVEMLNWLRAQNANLSPAGLGAEVLARLNQDGVWRLLASRIDFNVARAAYRGFLDRDYSAAEFPLKYELIGRDSNNNEQRLGQITFAANQSSKLPAARNLRQVIANRCDAPEQALDHGSVALDWAHGGAGPLQHFASELSTAGYDLYRTLENTDKNAPFAYSSLSRGSHIRGFDAQGRLLVDGLEKVNDQPIVISGAVSENNANLAQFRETQSELVARNVRPGDVRDYYLVARDFTGQYGQLAALKVEVPDLRAPMSPWNVELRQSSADQQLQFRWDAIDVANYINFFGSEQQICNADTARSEHRVRVLGKGRHCDMDAAVEHKLQVDGYLVYRFERFDQAAAFSDSDGDGYSDRDERIPLPTCSSDPDDPIRRAYAPAGPGDFQCTAPGTACNVAQVPAQGTSYLLSTLPASAATNQDNGKKIMQFADPVQGAGQVFWYRVASYSQSGGQRHVSELSPPLRAKFNDYTLPERSVLVDIVGAYVPNQACWAYETSLQEAISPKTVAFDHSGAAREVVLGCEYEGSRKPEELAGRLLRLPVARDGTVSLDAQACALINSACVVPDRGEPSLNVWFLGGAAQQLGMPQIISGFTAEKCESLQQVDLNSIYVGSGQYSSSQQTSCPAYRPVIPGENSTRFPIIKIQNLDLNHCVSLYRNIGGKDVRIKQQCGPFDGELDIGDIDLSDMRLGGEPMCLSATLHNDNNRVSARYALGCVRQQDRLARQPRPPQVLGLEYVDTTAIVRWRRPQEPTSATLIEVLDGDGANAEVILVKSVGHSDLGLDESGDFDSQSGQGPSAVTQSIQIELDSDPAAGEKTYCVRLRSVSSGAWEDVTSTLSDRTPAVCKTRVPPDEPLPEYMAWPKQDLPPQGQGLSAVWVGAPLILLSGGTLEALPAGCDEAVTVDEAHCGQLGSSDSLSSHMSTTQACSVTMTRTCHNLAEQNINQNVCGQFAESLRGRLDFVVYRQSRRSETAPASDYYQVSPLIDRFHCQTQLDPRQFESRNADPFILTLLDGAEPRGFYNTFSDQYPYVSGQQYRYQLVYFDSFGEIVRTRLTNWLTIP